MTFPRNKSRTITMNGHTYRWAISRPDRHFVQRLHVERADGSGGRLLCTFENRLDNNAEPLTPRRVRGLIERALREGWRPAEPRPFKLSPCPPRGPAWHAPVDPAWFTAPVPSDRDATLSLESWTSLDPIRRGFPWEHYTNVFGQFRVWGGSTDIQVGSLVASLAEDRGARPGSSREEAFRSLLPRDDEDAEEPLTYYLRGGRVVRRGGKIVVRHGCCTTLDEWVGWRDFLGSGEPPWNGHDPSSSAVRENGRIHLHDAEEEISVDEAGYARMVDALAQDMVDFVPRVEQWLDRHGAGARVRDQVVTILRRTLHLHEQAAQPPAASETW